MQVINFVFKLSFLFGINTLLRLFMFAVSLVVDEGSEEKEIFVVEALTHEQATKTTKRVQASK